MKQRCHNCGSQWWHACEGYMGTVLNCSSCPGWLASSGARAADVSGAPQVEGSSPSPTVPLWVAGMDFHSLERMGILSTLELVKGNKTHASNILWISIRTLRNKCKHYQVQGYTVPKNYSGPMGWRNRSK